ncbi:hypothetical protein GOHSU_28_00270 [Gordonia hirsuta DSM 44140 = NBRC 16056]|uniref:Uncharacterized protein n=1 Tax=Gordonia hirsuta DSM 44140 = NBRC 16056 TaxID=1121927 RepID=L7LD47_9ACTN|nr:DUF3824 domain-containing protein [Gordonia hirsuta]GAC57972.1 hypothetical protein GOHSU_28_00270 [Gordonia hirsuta DSM 44140 = NBRC 16056]
MNGPSPYDPQDQQSHPGQQQYYGQQQSYPGPQPYPGQQQFPGQQPYPGQSYPGQQPYPGQSYPGQPAYPGQPYPAAQQYPNQPQFAGGPYPGTPPTGGPSGVTSRIAAILALLGVIHMLVLLVNTAGASVDDISGLTASQVDSIETLNTAQLVTAILVGLLLAAGGVLMLLRNVIGRWLVIGGCVLDIIVWLVVGIWLQQVLSDVSDRPGVELDTAYATGMGIAWFIVLLFPIVTLVLALVPSTTKWFAATNA